MAAPPFPKAPLVALGLLTIATMLGPIAIFLAVIGGPSPNWPPDRAVEWFVFGGTVGSVVVLMAACLTVGLWSKPRKSSDDGKGPGGQADA